MLMNEKIHRHCENVTLPENSRMMFDITDGGIIKENELIRNNRNCVLVPFFQDVFELCNPIGAFKKKF